MEGYDEGFEEGLVEDDVAEELLLLHADDLGLEEQVALVPDVVLQVLAHQVRQERPDLQLHIPRH